LLRSELETDFLALVEAERAAEGEGQRTEVKITRSSSRHGARLSHRHLERNRRISLADLKEMNDGGIIKLTLGSDGRGTVRVTSEGFEEAKRIQGSQAVKESAQDSALDWDAEAYPVLQAVYRAYSNLPASAGVDQQAINAQLGRESTDGRTDRVLGELTAAGYLVGSGSAWQLSGPLRSRLSEKGLQLVANWPSGPNDALARGLLVAIEERIGEVESDDERNRLEKLGEAATSVGVNTLSSVLAKLATGGI
jgi:uncharacterized protein with LGFP repeats